MRLALTVPVELVDGKELWQELIGPAIVAVTAVAAAVIAARTANHRQEAQLANDRELQADQLAYDREQRNRQHVRDTVDESVRGVDSALRALLEYEGRIVLGDAQRTMRRKTVTTAGVVSPLARSAAQALGREMAEIRTASDAVSVAAADLISENLRLSLRLGKDHEIVRAHLTIRDDYSDRHSTLQSLSERSLSAKDKARIASAANATAAIVSAFMDECRRWFEEGR
jgi:hypothetical protein